MNPGQRVGTYVKRHDIAVQHSSTKSTWRTPPELFTALHREFNFQIDVAASDDDALCEEYFTEAEDGLAQPWHTEVGTCFMNPPHSREEHKPIEVWIEKAWIESQRGATVVGVIPLCPQTRWWLQYVYGYNELAEWNGHAAMEVRQIPHRVTFIDPATGEPAANAPGNTAISIWKPNPGYIGPWAPVVRYWDYLNRRQHRPAPDKPDPGWLALDTPRKGRGRDGQTESGQGRSAEDGVRRIP